MAGFGLDGVSTHELVFAHERGSRNVVEKTTFAMRRGRARHRCPSGLLFLARVAALTAITKGRNDSTTWDRGETHRRRRPPQRPSTPPRLCSTPRSATPHREQTADRPTDNAAPAPHHRLSYGSASTPDSLRSAAQCAARRSSPDHAYYLQVANRIDHNRACLSVARKLCRRAHHILRELDDDALTPIIPATRTPLLDNAA
jgi:hypothetical protein